MLGFHFGSPFLSFTPKDMDLNCARQAIFNLLKVFNAVQMSTPEQRRAFNAIMVLETREKNVMVGCVEGSTKIKHPQQGAYLSVHGKEKIVYLSGRSSFRGRESPEPRLIGFK